MAEVFAYMFVGILGFFVGGFIGSICYEGFNPYCWYGLCIALAIPLVAQGSLEICGDD